MGHNQLRFMVVKFSNYPNSTFFWSGGKLFFEAFIDFVLLHGGIRILKEKVNVFDGMGQHFLLTFSF
jgi:hypothetical protein